MKKTSNYIYNIKFSTPLDQDYNEIGVIEGDDVFLNFNLENYVGDLVGQGYNITVYDEEDRTSLASVSVGSGTVSMIIDNFSFDTDKALVVLENRSDITNIETIKTLGYIYFIKFDGGTTVGTVEGFVTYLNADETTTQVNYYTTGF